MRLETKDKKSYSCIKCGNKGFNKHTLRLGNIECTCLSCGYPVLDFRDIDLKEVVE